MENREVSYVCILPWLKMQVSCVIILFIFLEKDTTLSKFI